MNPKQIRATTTRQAFWTLDPFAVVRPDDLWYTRLETFFGRNEYGLSASIGRRLESGAGGPEFIHLGIVGGAGTGKTTQVRAALGKNPALVPAWVDAQAAFDTGAFTYSDFLLIVVNAVVNTLAEQQLDVPSAEAQLVHDWFAEELLVEEHRTQVVGEMKAELKGKLGIPLLAKLTGKIAGLLKSDNEYRKEVRKRADRDPADLLRRTNFLLDAAGAALKATGASRKLVVIIDNLEKIPDRGLVDTAILRRAAEICQLRAHLLLFFNPADHYAPISVQAGDAYPILTVPVMPVRNANEGPAVIHDSAAKAVRAMVDKRVDAEAIFEDPENAVQLVTRYSGGRLRDVLHLLRYACELADDGKATTDDVNRSIARLSAERSAMAHPEDWPRLAEVRRDKKVANRKDDGYLLLHSLVLNYDGVPWWDVHPLVAEDTRFKEHWQRLSGVTSS